MSVWQVDFYRRPLQDEAGNVLWELLLCDVEGSFSYSDVCPQPQASAAWLQELLERLANIGYFLPQTIQVFRPQTLALLEVACRGLGIVVEPTRHTPALKQLLKRQSLTYAQDPRYTRQPYAPLDLDRPPPLPLGEILWGDHWGFASYPAGDLLEVFRDCPIPFLAIPPDFVPLQLGIASTTPVPGVIITGGRRSIQLARWVQETRPVSLDFIPGAPDGLILEAGLADRWVVATFDDAEMRSAGAEFERRKQVTQGFHFVLVQPDESGMTYSGFWLLQAEKLL
jgi:hypothetical protein